MRLTFFHIMETLVIILDSSMVEHSAVNRVVVGSSPTRGADEKFSDEGLRTFFNKTNVP